MTLHTRIAVTAGSVTIDQAFEKARELIGATTDYTFFRTPDPDSENEHRRTMTPGLHMDMGQGLPALMWVEQGDGEPEPHDEWCDDECSGEYHDPAHVVMVHFDTAYGYRAANNASCSDLHAWLVRETGAWLTALGATWEWYDESGDGWNHGDGWGALGNPDVGQIGSSVDRLTSDPKRDFGLSVLGLIGGQ